MFLVRVWLLILGVCWLVGGERLGLSFGEVSAFAAFDAPDAPDSAEEELDEGEDVVDEADDAEPAIVVAWVGTGPSPRGWITSPGARPGCDRICAGWSAPPPRRPPRV